MTKYHVVKCDNHGGWFKTGLALGAVVMLYAGVKWTYERVLLPALHIAGLVLVYGGLAIGALTALLAAGLIVVCLVERYRHGHSARSRRVAYLPGPRVALQDPGVASGRQAIEANTSLPARPVDQLEARKPDSLIKCEDDVFTLTHGIVPINWDKL